MLKSSKPGLTQKSKSAVATNKTEVSAAGSTGKSKPTAATGKIAAKPARNSSSVPANQAHSTGNGADRQEMIAIAAYYRAERRGFDGGDAMQDWLEAEAEIDAAAYH